MGQYRKKEGGAVMADLTTVVAVLAAHSKLSAGMKCAILGNDAWPALDSGFLAEASKLVHGIQAIMPTVDAPAVEQLKRIHCYWSWIVIFCSL